MMTKQEVLEWIETIADDSYIAIDEGGLSLVEVNADHKQTESYLEVGMTPDEEDMLDGDDDEED